MASYTHYKEYINMTTIILFNGPPNSGKDAAAEYLSDTYGAFHSSFKTHLFEVTQTIYNIVPYVWNHWYSREGKEIPREELGGLSCRQALIYISEEIVKPVFGKDFWGKSEAKWLIKYMEGDEVVVFSDAGFDDEVTPLVDAFGKENVYIIKIEREGCSYKGDSRNYLSDGLVSEENYYTIKNNGTLEEFKENVEKLYNYITSQ